MQFIKISHFVDNHTFEDFIDNSWDQDALARNLEIIGEAANNMDQSFRNEIPDVPWRQIIDFRNIVVHDYADLDSQIVWEIATNNLPKLKEQLQALLHKHESLV